MKISVRVHSCSIILEKSVFVFIHVPANMDGHQYSLYTCSGSFIPDKVCFQVHEKKSACTRHIFAIHHGMRQASLDKVSKLDADKYMAPVYEPKEMTPQYIQDSKYITEVEKKYDFHNLQEGCSHILSEYD